MRAGKPRSIEHMEETGWYKPYIKWRPHVRFLHETILSCSAGMLSNRDQPLIPKHRDMLAPMGSPDV